MESRTVWKRERVPEIEPYMRVLTGNLSWWGIDAHFWYKSEDECGQKFASDAVALGKKNIYISHFMSTEPESRYGNYGFVVNFKDLLK